MSEVLSGSQILEAKDLTIEDVSVPEWPGSDGEPGIIKIHQLSAEGIMVFQNEMTKPENKTLGMFVILVFTAMSGDGTPLFPLPEDEAERALVLAGYIASLKKKNMNVLNRLQRVALRVNSMLPEKTAALKKD
jgi:hypothetical protein